MLYIQLQGFDKKSFEVHFRHKGNYVRTPAPCFERIYTA